MTGGPGPRPGRGRLDGAAPRGAAPTGRVALALLSAVLVGAAGAACSDADGSGGDTSSVGSELLSSRGGIDGGVPLAGRDGESEVAVDVSRLGHEWGDSAAPLRVLEFSDFACGYCRTFHTETWPTLRERYVASGKVRWKFVPMELGMFGPNSEDAALAAECAGAQGRFREMADALFGEQSSWKRVGDPVPVFRELAVEAGVEPGPWSACVEEGALRDRVESGTRLSRQLGVRGTPTFFVVGYGAIPGAIPLEVFEEVLDSAYADATRAGSESE